MVNPPLGGRAQPIGFAHRGARAERPENTLEAFVRALELGATGLESDAWLTADEVVVLDHDGVVGPPWRRRPIRDLPRSALPAHIPSLAQLYACCGSDYELSLDIKDPEVLAPVVAVAAAAEAAAPGRLWLCDQGWQDPAKVRAGQPGHLVESTRLDAIPEGVAARATALAAIGVEALNLPGHEWRAETVGDAHRAGILAFGWNAQRREHISRLIRLGVDGIYSDHVDRLMAEIGGPASSADAPGPSG